MAVLRLAVLRFFAVLLLAVLRFAVLRFFAVLLLAVLRFAVLRFAVDRLADERLADERVFVPDFFAPAFLALDFLAEVLRVEEERDPERVELREPERDEERVAAAIAAGAVSSTSSLVASPIGGSLQVTSAAGASDDSLHEPVFDVSDVSPVPLQSSWVIN